MALSTQHGPDAFGKARGLIRKWPTGCNTCRQIVGILRHQGGSDSVGLGKIPPGLVDHQDRAGFIEHADMRGQRIEG